MLVSTAVREEQLHTGRRASQNHLEAFSNSHILSSENWYSAADAARDPATVTTKTKANLY